MSAKDPKDYKIIKDTYLTECKKTHDFKVKIPSMNISFNSCPCNFKTPSFSTYLSLLDAEERGHLPESGGYLDQTSKTMDAINLVRSLRDKHREYLEKSTKSK